MGEEEKQPFVVIGHYDPPKWSARRVGRDLLALTKGLGLVPHNDPEHPAQDWTPWHSLADHAEVKRRTPKNPQGEGWHQDGDLTPGSKMECAIVLWASNTPTQFKSLSSSTIHTPSPREVVLFSNKGCYHRRPPDAPRVRWTFRQRVVVPSHIQLP